MPFRISVDELLLIPDDDDSLASDVEGELSSFVLSESRQIEIFALNFDTKGRSDSLDFCVTEEGERVLVVEGVVSRIDVLERFERGEFEIRGPVREESFVRVILFRRETLDLFGRSSRC